MKRRILLFSMFALVCAYPCSLLALGGDHTNSQPVHANEKWPEGLADLVNRQDRVYGYWVNWEDVFFYEGGTKAFNDFLADYAKLENTILQLVIHPGPKHASAPWSDSDSGISVDWSLYTASLNIENLMARKPNGDFITRIDLFLGKNIGLKGLEVPENIEVLSGNEIETFVNAHNERQQPGKGKSDL